MAHSALLRVVELFSALAVSFHAAAAGSALAFSGGKTQPARTKKLDIRNHPLEGIRREKIKITGVKLMHLSYRLKPGEEWPDADSHVVAWKTESAIVKVSTDAGITGLGSCNQFKGPRQMKEYTEAVIAPILSGKNQSRLFDGVVVLYQRLPH